MHASCLAQGLIDVAPLHNIHHTLNSTDKWGSGVCFYDFDHDGWDDLTLLQENDSLIFYKNINGSFAVLPSFTHNYGETKQLLWVDYDNDGDDDIFISTKNGPLRILNNNGSFEFTDVSIAAGMPLVSAPNFGVSFGDFNKDGWLDFYVCRYIHTGDSLDPNLLNALYRNNGNGTFTNVTQTAGVGNGVKTSFMSIWMDYNNDSWPDLLVINDRVIFNNALYRNNGDGTFTDVAQQEGFTMPGHNPMSLSCADYDNDGDMDVYITNTGLGSKAHLFSAVNGGFAENASLRGVDNNDYAWGAAWLDLNNDTYRDLFVCTGLLHPILPEVRSFLYMNNFGQNFSDSPQLLLSNSIAASHSVAQGDINNDGFTDLVVQNTNTAESVLWQNTWQQGSWCKVTLQGTVSNRMAIGSHIGVFANGMAYAHYTFCGQDYLGQSSQHIHFGLGSAIQIDSIVIKYLSGVTDRYYQLPVNQSYNFIEGETHQLNINYNGSLTNCAGDSVVLDAGEYLSYSWNNGWNQRYLAVNQTGDYWVTVQDSLGLNIRSDTLSVWVAAMPFISAQVNHVTCAGNSDASVQLSLQTSALNYSVNWNNGQSGLVIAGLSPAMYSFVYSDEFGCVYHDSMMIYEPQALGFLYNVIPFTDNNAGVIQMQGYGGIPPYEYFVNGLPHQGMMEQLQPGVYLAEVKDMNQCVYSNWVDVLDNSTTQLEDYFSASSTNVFPNPLVENGFNILSSKKMVSVELFDFTGRRISLYPSGNYYQFPDDSKGIFNVIIRFEEGLESFRLIRN
jgi:hypothetical protein